MNRYLLNETSMFRFAQCKHCPLRGTKKNENRWEQERTWVPGFFSLRSMQALRLDRGLRLKPNTQQVFSDEKGTALIVAMIFLGLLTTIGLFAIFNSTTELTSSARYKSDKEAFYAAEGAIEYVKGDGYYFTTKGAMDFPDNAHPTAAARNLSAEGTNATGTVTYISQGNPPPGYGFSAKDTSANYFVIEATGTSQAGIQSIQEEGVAKILPKS